jgi:hypothetical protein
MSDMAWEWSAQAIAPLLKADASIWRIPQICGWRMWFLRFPSVVALYSKLLSLWRGFWKHVIGYHIFQFMLFIGAYVRLRSFLMLPLTFLPLLLSPSPPSAWLSFHTHESQDCVCQGSSPSLTKCGRSCCSISLAPALDGVWTSSILTVCSSSESIPSFCCFGCYVAPPPVLHFRSLPHPCPPLFCCSSSYQTCGRVGDSIGVLTCCYASSEEHDTCEGIQCAFSS